MDKEDSNDGGGEESQPENSSWQRGFSRLTRLMALVGWSASARSGRTTN